MKKYMFLCSIVLFMLLFTNVSHARIDLEILNRYNSISPVYYRDTQDPVIIPKEIKYTKQQFRGVWVATVSNIDMPFHKSEQEYKQEYLSVLDTLERYNMNAVIFQVRPMNDAFYQSNLNPWSRYLTETEGKDPGWDIMSWMVEETHKRGMEFHAWLNPYRVTNSPVSNKEEYLQSLDNINFAKLHPEYVLSGLEDKLVLNPGEPKVRQFIFDTIDEIVTNYDVDAIHFDDYFYPYDKVAVSEDAETYNLYNPNNLSLDDWRRENVDLLIKGIKDLLTTYNQTENKAVQLGISPFGIWANKKDHPEGSNTAGGNTYFSHYADTRKWVKEEWIDYIAPQNYFEFEKELAPHADVTDWWVKQMEGTDVNLYIGHGLYRHKEKSSYLWQSNDSEVYNQLKYNGKFNEVDGSVFFSYKHFVESNFTDNAALVGDRNKIKNDAFKYKVLPKPLGNVDNVLPESPKNVNITKVNDKYQLTWNNDEDTKAYYVYRYESNEKAYLHDPANIVGVINAYFATNMQFVDESADVNTDYKYFITAFDRANNESIATGINTNNEVINPDDDTVIQIEDKLDTISINLYKINTLINDVNNEKSIILTKASDLDIILSQLKTKYNSLNSEIVNTNNIIDSIKNQKKNIEGLITSLEEEIYNELLHKNSVDKDKVKQIQLKLTDLKNEQEKIIKNLTDLETDLSTLNNKRSVLAKEITATETKIIDVNNEIDCLKNRQDNLLDLINAIQKILDEIEIQKSALSIEDQVTLDEINSVINKLSQIITVKNNNTTIINNLIKDASDIAKTKNDMFSKVMVLKNTLVSVEDLKNDYNEYINNKEDKFADFDTMVTYLESLLPDDTNSNTSPNPADVPEEVKTNNLNVIFSVVGGVAILGCCGFLIIKGMKK